MHEQLATLVLLLPALAALLAWAGQMVFGQKCAVLSAQLLTSGAVIVACIFSWMLFTDIALYNATPVDAVLWQWLDAGNWQVNFGVFVDKLTAVMLIVVTTVSACVHVYSVGYMSEDKSQPRFFAYLSFFTFTMLALVMAPNLLQMFLGWEGVGVASYLLIGFWYQKESANAAAMKAFITNRIADAFLLLGIFILLFAFGSLEYTVMFAQMGQVSGTLFHFLGYEVSTVELAALCLFIGAMGKSAQFGLHVWLPDAMEGPTPVSALIHAATMVTAGVFLLCRMSPLFEVAEGTLFLVACVGALTAIFAATVGLTQTDIKRVIAYSTCSQLGYMFFAIGVSAYPAAMFHLTTHAFFKALLFLGAGSVIHGLHHEQNLFKMGGLKTVLPVTYGLMWIGSLALVGIPPFAGFFSKDMILESAFGAHSDLGYILYVLGTLGALLTAFYSFRLLFLAFHQQHKGEKDAIQHAHESPLVMLLPMIVLAIGAVFSGYWLLDMTYENWWAGSIVIADHHQALYNAHYTPLFWKYLPLFISVLGIGAAVFFYLLRTHLAKATAENMPGLYQFLLNKWYIDEVYQFLITRPIAYTSRLMWQKGDVKGIDALLPNGAAYAVRYLGSAVRMIQTGRIYDYAFIMIIALIFIVALLSTGVIY